MYNKHGKDNFNSIPVIQISLQGKILKKWENIKLAQETLKIFHISDCCKGKRNQAGGYKWKYVRGYGRRI